jgi:hypothetical protein
MDNVFSITLDNASLNAYAMSKLIPKFLGYLGPDLNHLTMITCVASCTIVVHATL